MTWAKECCAVASSSALLMHPEGVPSQLTCKPSPIRVNDCQRDVDVAASRVQIRTDDLL